MDRLRQQYGKTVVGHRKPSNAEELAFPKERFVGINAHISAKKEEPILTDGLLDLLFHLLH